MTDYIGRSKLYSITNFIMKTIKLRSQDCKGGCSHHPTDNQIEEQRGYLLRLLQNIDEKTKGCFTVHSSTNYVANIIIKLWARMFPGQEARGSETKAGEILSLVVTRDSVKVSLQEGKSYIKIWARQLPSIWRPRDKYLEPKNRYIPTFMSTARAQLELFGERASILPYIAQSTDPAITGLTRFIGVGRREHPVITIGQEEEAPQNTQAGRHLDIQPNLKLTCPAENERDQVLYPSAASKKSTTAPQPTADDRQAPVTTRIRDPRLLKSFPEKEENKTKVKNHDKWLQKFGIPNKTLPRQKTVTSPRPSTSTAPASSTGPEPTPVPAMTLKPARYAANKTDNTPQTEQTKKRVRFSADIPAEDVKRPKLIPACLKPPVTTMISLAENPAKVVQRSKLIPACHRPTATSTVTSTSQSASRKRVEISRELMFADSDSSDTEYGPQSPPPRPAPFRLPDGRLMKVEPEDH